MRCLTLIRHAHAEAERAGIKDFDRSLSETGVREARAAALKLAAENPQVDLILSSPAVRALQTAQIFARALAYPEPRIGTDASLYLASPDAILAALEDIEDAVRHVLVFGHNPGISILARQLSANSRMPELNTAGVFSIQLTLPSWAEARTL